MKGLLVRPAAEHELRAAAKWYDEKRPGLGLEFLALVDEAFGKIQRRAETYPLWTTKRDYRRLNLSRFPYSIFYRVTSEVIVIVAVAHQRRRTGYWAKELR